jgi:hypothetical protein
MALSAPNNPYQTMVNRTVDKIQDYASVMEDLLKNYFKDLYAAPDALFIMMATMALESSYRLTPVNHRSIGTTSRLGKAFWNDPIITPYTSVIHTLTTDKQEALQEGLSAKALMATMGLYQFRNTKESNYILSLRGDYRSIAEEFGILVDPTSGTKPSSKFPDNAVGARASMMFGCMIMEGKFLSRRRSGYESAAAMTQAVKDYVGQENARDILGTSPQDRLNSINDINDPRIRMLARAGITRDGSDVKLYITQRLPRGPVEKKTTPVAQTDNVPTGQPGCRRKNVA